MNAIGLRHTFSLASSEARLICLATQEKRSARGRNKASLKAVPHAVAAAVMALGMSPAFSQVNNVCGGSASITINGPQAPGDTCIPDAGAALVIGPTGVLSGASRAITRADATGTSIDNQGSVSGTRTGVRVTGTPFVFLTNSGSIVGTSDEGVVLRGGGGFTGNLTNTSTGTISGGVGIRMDNPGGQSVARIGGNLVNQGSIIGTASDGIRVDQGSVITGAIINSGTIQGALTGVSVVDSSVITGGIINSGIISGANFAIYDVLGNIPTIDITGNNTARFTGDVKAAGANVAVKAGATFANTNAFDVFGFTVENTGTFNFGAGANTTGGLTTSGVKVGSNGFTNAGTLSIANGVTASINGNYTQASTGTLKIGASANTGFGKLVVSGTATLPGAAKIDVDVNSVNTLANGQTMAGVLSAGTLSASTFAVTTNSVLFSFTGTVNGNAVDLAVASAGGGGSGSTVVASVNGLNTSPAKGVAPVLDSLITAAPGGDMGTVVTALGQLTTQQQVSDAAKQTLPLLTGTLSQITNTTLGDINRVVQSRIQFSRGLSSGDSFYGDKNIWLKPFTSSASQGDRSGVAGFKAGSSGLVLGGDAALTPTTRIGAAFAYAGSTVDGRDAAAPARAKVDVYSAVGYSSVQLSNDTQADFQLGLGRNTNQGSRTINFGGLSRVASSSFNSVSGYLGAGVERRVALSGSSTLTPSLRADYTAVRDDAYTETGAGALNLAVNSHISRSLVLSIGGRFDHAYDSRQTVSLDLGAGYDALASRNSLVAAFAGTPNTSFITQGPDASAWLIRVGLSYVYKASDVVDVSARYDADVREKFTNQTVSLRARWVF